VFHDVAKPQCTRRDGDRLSTHGHSAKGAIFARGAMWKMDVEFGVREAVCGLVRHHQIPMHGIDRPDIQRVVYRISHTARCDLLAILSEADIRGRVCQDHTRLLENVELFRQYATDHECYRQPRRFASDHSRFVYFRIEGRDPNYPAYDDTQFTVTLMSGLPGSGKDTWVASHAAGMAVVSLDDIRQRENISSRRSQGAVVAAAREEARQLLRRKSDFVWNATNVSLELRSQVIDLCAGYHARIRIVYLETDFTEWERRNRERDSKVPDEVRRRLLDRWELPDLTEGHEVHYVRG